MDVERASSNAQAWVLVMIVAASALVVLPTTVEPFMLPKATVVVGLSSVLAFLAAARAIWTRQLAIPVSRATLAVSAFAFAILVVTVTSPAALASIIGVNGRYTGAVAYFSYIVLFISVLALKGHGLEWLLAKTLLMVAAPVVAYGLVQAAGAEPFGFKGIGLGTTFSTFGNINFAGAWMGAVVAVVLAAALSPIFSRRWRVYAALLLPLALLYALLTTTAQAIVLSGLSLLWVLALLVLVPRWATSDRTGRRRAVIAAVPVLLVVVMGTVIAAPAVRASLEASLVERPDFWSAAISIWREHPLLGTGLDTYAHHFMAHRPFSHVQTYGAATSNAPHSVPLGMLSNGGALLALTYLAVVVAVGLALFRAVAMTAADTAAHTRFVLAAWGGLWLSYQAQSLISMDVPPLAVLHWISAAIILTVAAPPHWKGWRLPGRAVTRAAKRRGRRQPAGAVSASTWALMSLAGLLTLTLLWLSLYPLRADLTAASAEPLTQQGRYQEAAVVFERAADFNPSEASYAFLAARAHEAAGQAELALREAEEAASRDPGGVQYALFAAQTAQQAGLAARANRWYREAVLRDPLNPPVLVTAARYLLQAGDANGAHDLAQRAVTLRDDLETRTLLEQAAAAAR